MVKSKEVTSYYRSTEGTDVGNVPVLQRKQSRKGDEEEGDETSLRTYTYPGDVGVRHSCRSPFLLVIKDLYR